MAEQYKIKLVLSNASSDKYHDGKMKCLYNYIFNNTNIDSVLPKLKEGRVSYDNSIASTHTYNPIIMNYTVNEKYDLKDYQGYTEYSSNTSTYMSFYRREYDQYEYVDDTGKTQISEYKGEWQPVAIEFLQGYFRDFNVQNDHIYQYIAHTPDSLQYDLIEDNQGMQLFANFDSEDTGSKGPAFFGEPVFCKWSEWSLIELIPVENQVNAPIVKKAYKANLDQLWLFKYDLQVGAQTQNIVRNDIQTLGQFNKIGFGEQDFVSGDVTALLGSEIVIGSKQGYVERLWRSRNTPLSTNEKVTMLQQWRKLVSSKNPKLLKDMKGQSWIVQITSSSNTPKNGYYQQPDSISFQWKQVESLDNVIIYGDPMDLPKSGCSNYNNYTSIYRNPNDSRYKCTSCDKDK